jgi:hypothetical protein
MSGTSTKIDPGAAGPQIGGPAAPGSAIAPVGSGLVSLLPAVRFAGTVWLVAFAAVLPRTRVSRHR